MARPRSDIRPRLVDAARRRFLAQGVDGASIREIARDAGTNVGMVVYYFPTKDDLFLAVLEEVYEKILKDLEVALTAPIALRERLRRALVRLGTASDHELEVIRLVAREALLSSTRYGHLVERFMRGHLPLFLAALAEGVREGELDDIPLPLLVLSVIGLCGLPQFIRRATQGVPLFRPLPDAEGLAEFSLGLLFRAVGARPTRAKKGKGKRPKPRASRPKRRRG